MKNQTQVSVPQALKNATGHPPIENSLAMQSAQNIDLSPQSQTMQALLQTARQNFPQQMQFAQF